MNTQFLGLGKTKFNSSICLIDQDKSTIELLISERLNRKKNSGSWPEIALKKINSKLIRNKLSIGENRDVHDPKTIEDTQNLFFPFYEYLQKNKLDFFTSHFNPNIKHLTHHLSHAYAALAISPFEKSILIVMDGAGSKISSIDYEECTIYLQDGVNLVEIFKRYIKFETSSKDSSSTLGNQIGASYEKASEFIFNSPNSSGKVMGLAPFGTALNINDHLMFQENLPWKKSFKGRSKLEWENLNHELFQDIAATVQKKLEEEYEQIITTISDQYPEYKNLILTGGCALNCTNNAKIYYQNKFENIFVPPFPGDESISFGVAHFLQFQNSPETWQPTPFEIQSAYFGPIDSIPTPEQIEKEFSPKLFNISRSINVIDDTAKLLNDGKIIAWFQGRSESGPRALGNRSILADPSILNIKQYLNLKIKFRENFRPYGCSVLHEKAHLYFNVHKNFNNPYMSFAIKVRPEFQFKLKEVSHIDGTSRMQTVRAGQNSKFYKLIEAFGKLNGIYCLLNTSMNIMNEPMVENIHDAMKFFLQTPVDYLVIEDFIISKKVQ